MTDAPVRKIPRAPAGLGTVGRKLWRDTLQAYGLRVDELRVLEHAARTLDLIEQLQVALVDAPMMVRGAQGQPASNPLLTEIRQQRNLVAALFRQLKLPDPDQGAGEVSRSVIARNAARSRWAVTHGAPMPPPTQSRWVQDHGHAS